MAVLQSLSCATKLQLIQKALPLTSSSLLKLNSDVSVSWYLLPRSHSLHTSIDKCRGGNWWSFKSGRLPHVTEVTSAEALRDCCIRSLATKPKGSIQEVKTPKEGEITAAKKVVQAGKDVTYLGVIIVGLGITALMFFTVGKELFSSKSPNVVYTRALKLCKQSDEVTALFGLPLKGYGEMTRRKRRRHVSHFEYEKDGRLYMRVKFYIEGPDKKGTVNCEVRENDNGEFEYRYLFVEVDGYPPQTIILEDNR